MLGGRTGSRSSLRASPASLTNYCFLGSLAINALLLLTYLSSRLPHPQQTTARSREVDTALNRAESVLTQLKGEIEVVTAQLQATKETLQEQQQAQGGAGLLGLAGTRVQAGGLGSAGQGGQAQAAAEGGAHIRGLGGRQAGQQLDGGGAAQQAQHASGAVEADGGAASQSGSGGQQGHDSVLAGTQAAQPPPTAGAAKAWLAIGIPSVPRKNGSDYLTRTLESLLEELPADATDPLYGRVKVVVMNNRPGQHPVFESVRRRFALQAADDGPARKAATYVQFVDNPGTVKDPAPHLPDPDDLNNPTNRPGREVRRQTCDLITLMEHAQPLAHYYLFLEDDFRVCPYALRALQYAVRKLNTVPSLQRWIALRVSYGMNGVLVPMDLLPSLAGYMRKHTARLPPDLLWIEWFSGRKPELWRTLRGRPLAVFRYNLLDHIGTVSSFAVRPDRPAWPGCYDSMADVWSLHRSERFNARRCAAADLSPCPPEDGGEAWARLPLPWLSAQT